MTSDYSMSPDLIPEIALPRCVINQWRVLLW
jgi:hypothetical protein